MKITARPSEEHNRLAEAITEILLQGYHQYKTSKNEIKNVVAYFLRYTYIPLVETTDYNKALDNAIKVFISAPWIGSEEDKYVTAFEFLIAKNFINLMLDKTRYNISINKAFDCGDKIQTFKRFIDEAETEKNNRENYIIISNNNEDIELRRAIEHELAFDDKKKLTLKIMAYHGKTWLGTDGWIYNIIDKYKNLKVKILIVGRNPTIEVREGADMKTHKNSIKNGFRELYRLYRATKGRVDVRFYGGKNKYSYLRGAIIEDADDNICYCHITCWRMGEERGNYGKDINIHNDVSLTYIVNSYFETVFKKSQCVGPKFRKVTSFLRAYTYWIIFAIAITAIFVIKSICDIMISSEIASIVFDGMYALTVFVLGVIVPIIVTEYIEIHKDR